MTKPNPPIKPTAYECHFAFYSKHADGDSDIHLVKEIRHYEDGRTEPALRILKDHKRPFYITKKGAQNHESKKEAELMSNVIKYECTQTRLIPSIAKALNMNWFNGGLRDLQKSPFIYGSDQLSTTYIKQSYMNKWPNAVSAYTLACFDTETDVVHGTEEIVMATISFKTKIFTAVRKSFVAGYADVINRLQQLAQKYIGEDLKARNATIEFVIVEDEMAIIRATMAKGHEWQPDFMAVWNLPFDIEKMLSACSRNQVDPKDIFNDPIVPPEYRSFRFKKGEAKKVTASGKVMNFKPAQRWHTVFSPASFYWVDAMCAYRQIRTGQAEEPSYSLDAILNKQLKRRKLKFDQASEYSDLAWHRVMQSKYPLEYVIYNIFDCVGMELLDEKTLDLSLSMPMYAGPTDFTNFNSQPKKLCDRLTQFYLERDQVFGTTSSKMDEDVDQETATISDWIIALPAELVYNTGLPLIAENPLQTTNVRLHASDLDATASYPSNEIAINISKKTTRKERLLIPGVNEHDIRMNTLGLSAGHVNALQFCNEILDMPTLDQMLTAFQATLS